VAEIRVRFSVGPLIRKVAGYGSPGRFAKPCGFAAMWVQIPRLPPVGSMVKRKSCVGSNDEFWVQILVELLYVWCGVCGVAVTACLAVNQEVRVQLPSDTPLIYTSVLLGEPAASKTASRGSTPRARAHVPMV
jgi:hypothetical protein